MSSLLFLVVGAGVFVIGAARHSGKVRSAVKKHSGKLSLLPQAISLLVISVQIPELLKVVEHVSPANVAGALFLLAILVASKSGTEGELH
ncbi:MAG TPA: hypothetical protein VE973_02775 [Candidatus Limnocylindria bacterium]|nr:hypothetical protein [Candidatus Limnocylindria bacterium]